jgi:hypothetical protein
MATLNKAKKDFSAVGAFDGIDLRGDGTRDQFALLDGREPKGLRWNNDKDCKICCRDGSVECRLATEACLGYDVSKADPQTWY